MEFSDTDHQEAEPVGNHDQVAVTDGEQFPDSTTGDDDLDDTIEPELDIQVTSV
jgi:hypothetical protein